MKRILAISLVIAMVFAMTTTVFAANSGSSSGTSTGTGGSGSGTTQPVGDVTVRQVLSDGTIVETTTHPDGTVTVVTTTVEETTNEEGTKATVTTVTTVEKDKNGNVVSTAVDKRIVIVISDEDAADGKSLAPVEVEEDENVVIEIICNYPVEVTLPVKDADNGTVVENEDGTVKNDCYVNEQGVVFDIEGNAQVKVIDNTKKFDDVSGWATEAIKFVAARELFVGTGDGQFSPNMTVTRAMVWTVLARLSGADLDTTGANWYEAPMAWAVANGISDGTNPTGVVTREQLVTMLYRFCAASPVEADLTAFGDADSVNAWAADAMAWAVANGIINGINGNLVPQGETSRAEFAAVMMRFIQNI
jgi:hypothetical protein